MPRVTSDRTAQNLHAVAPRVHAATAPVRQRDHAVDVRIRGEPLVPEVIGDSARDGRRAVDRRQDADVVARRDAAVGTDDAHESRRRIDVLRGFRIDAERVIAIERTHLQVVEMDVLAGGNVATREADDLVVAAHRLALADRVRGDLVAGRDESADRDLLVEQLGAAHELRAGDDDVVGGMQPDRQRGAGEHGSSFVKGGRVARATARLLDLREVPVDAEPGRRRRDGAAVGNDEARAGEVIELRDVLDPRGARHRRRQRHVQLHEEMRADRHVERLRQMRDLEPWRDPADPRHVGLDNRARITFEILAEMRGVVERLADGDRDGRVCRELDVAGEILRRQRLLEPREAERLERAGAADRLRNAEALIRVDHELEGIADGFAHRGEPRDILRDMRLSDFQFRAAESGGLGFQCLRNQRFGRQMQPAALGRVHGHPRPRATRRLPQREADPFAAQIP